MKNLGFTSTMIQSTMKCEWRSVIFMMMAYGLVALNVQIGVDVGTVFSKRNMFMIYIGGKT